MVVPIIIEALGTISNRFDQEIQKLPTTIDFRMLQKALFAWNSKDMETRAEYLSLHQRIDN